MRRLALLGLLWAAPALAQSGAMVALRPGSAMSVMGQRLGAMSGAAGGAAPVSYTGPGDSVSGATAWWGLRAYNAAYATGSNPAITIRRASDNTTATIDILITGQLGVAAASAFCASTTCYVTEAFDQTGNGYNATQTTAANQPQLSFSCIGSLPCMLFAGSQELNTSTIVVNTPLSFSAASVRTSSFSTEQFMIGQAVNPYDQLAYDASANTVHVFTGANSSFLYATQTDNITHAFQGIITTAGVTINVDGNVTSNTTAGATGISTAVSVGLDLYGNIEEAGVWPVAFTPTQQAAVCHNQNVAYSLGLSC